MTKHIINGSWHVPVTFDFFGVSASGLSMTVQRAGEWLRNDDTLSVVDSDFKTMVIRLDA